LHDGLGFLSSMAALFYRTIRGFVTRPVGT
jgi:hypothetical protein